MANVLQQLLSKAQSVEQNPNMQRMIQSPLSKLLQVGTGINPGAIKGVIPATKKLASDPTYNPQVMFGGEMQETPGLGFLKAGAEPQTTYPFAKSVKVDPKTMEQNQAVRQIRFKGSQNAPAQEQNAHSTLDRLGFKGSADEQLSFIPKAKDAIYQWVKGDSSLAKQPTNVPIKEVEGEISAQLKKQYGSSAPQGQTLDQVVKQHMNDVYDNARAEQQVLSQQPQTGKVNPYFEETPNNGPVTTKGSPVDGTTQYRRMGGVNPGVQGPPGFLRAFQAGGQEPAPQFAVEGNGIGQNVSGESAQMNPVPETVNSQSLYNMKVAANNSPEVSSAFDKIMNGKGDELTAQEKTALAARNAYDSILSKYHPDVKQATQDLSVLNNKHVYGGLESARFKEPPAPPTFGDRLKGIATNPVVDLTLGGILGGGGAHGIAGAVGNIAGAVGVGINALGAHLHHDPTESSSNQVESSQVNNDINSNQYDTLHNGVTISKDNKNVKRYGFVNDPVKTGQMLDTNSYTNADNQLTQAIANASANGDNVTAQRLSGQQNALRNSFQNQKPLRDAWTNPDTGIGNALTVAGSAYQAVKSADPGFYNAFNKGYDGLMNAGNPNYAHMAAYLQFLQNATGVDFTRFKTRDALTGAIDTAVSGLKNKWDSLQQQQFGNNAPTQSNTLNKILSPQGQQVQQAPPTPRVSFPPGGFGGGADSLTGHPMLDQALQQ